MDATDTFLDLVEHLCTRRNMYVLDGSFYEVCAYLTGFAQASADCPLSDDGFNVFGTFVCRHFGFPENYAWPYVLKTCSRDDDEATERLRSMLVDFSNRARTQSHEEILESVQPPVRENHPEPQNTLRRLLAALLRGRRDEIEPLIQDHPDAEVLWQGAYPSEVADVLNRTSESRPIAVVHASNDEVKLITGEFPFPITVRKIGEQWQVDAERIIAMRRTAQEPRS